MYFCPMLKPVIIVADGSFPQHEIPLDFLRNAEKIVCCDGGARALVNFGLEPTAIVGDMDSLNEGLAKRFSDRIFKDDNQETNDLTKAVTWCTESGFRDLIIVGATGKREDHTLGNISLLAEYCKSVKVKMVTDTGYFLPFDHSSMIETYPGQQISLFSINPETEITSSGLRYPLNQKKIRNWWEATLNEALGTQVELRFEKGMVIVFLKF